ncbi:DNA-directed RNA polymerase I subunit RPA49-like isoform X2 [Stegodyphus dumicola]|uniref:DNA-directed RNA polymerase I subunit RPA49-like isoform X2 n=1 Tax=Stegodyphus dumicola TaxID=202533 RepID=UPI0015AC6270|nr:DNA-directed RNA polymerase I subunit RPA49-like isoform X2 [Stegodyphus dumicola]
MITVGSTERPLCLVGFPFTNLENINGMKFKLHKDSKSSTVKKPERILVADNGHIKYTGCNYKSTEEASCLFKVGVFHKRSQKFKFYDAEVFHLQPLLNSHMEVNKTGSYQADDLTLAFGSKSRQKMINSRRNLGPAESNVIDSEFLKFDTNENLGMKIITAEEYDALESHAEFLLGASYEKIAVWKQASVYCDVVIKYLESSCGSLTLHNAKLLCYLQYMMCFLKLTYLDMRKKDPVPHVPEPFKQKLKDKFFLKNRSFPPSMKDKLLAYAMVLALTLHHYNLNGNLLASSCKIAMKRIDLIAGALGCHVRQKDDVKWIELKLPLRELKIEKQRK